jgi:hypothetical protein
VEAKWEIWSNKEGKKITARFHGLVKDKVDFELKNGKRVSYPLEQLSAEGQARIQGLIDSPVMMSEDD